MLVLTLKASVDFPSYKNMRLFRWTTVESFFFFSFFYFYSYFNILKLREMKSSFCLKDRLAIIVIILFVMY